MALLERSETLLPDVFARWFAQRGWAPRAHQLELLAKAREGRSTLLIAPTGGGKTLAGFLPTLVELHEAASRAGSRRRSGVERPRDFSHRGGGRSAASTRSTSRRSKRWQWTSRATWKSRSREMGLAVRLETRTGDTPASKRARQRRDPPDILLTTPEQLALLLATADAPYLFAHAAPRRARRIAFAGHLQARRSAVARPCAAVRAGAGAHHGRPLRHRGRARRPRPLPRAAAGGRRSARRYRRRCSRRAAAA